MTNRERMLRDYTRHCARRARTVEWGAEPASSLMKRLARTPPGNRPVEHDALAEWLVDATHDEAAGRITASAAARWLAGFDMHFLRELGQFPGVGSSADRFGLVFHHQTTESSRSCLEVIDSVKPGISCRHGPDDTLSFLSKQKSGGPILKLLRTASDYSIGVGKPFPEELAVERMGEKGKLLAEAAELVCRRLFFGRTPASVHAYAEAKEISRYLAQFLHTLAGVLAEAGIPLHPALPPVLECLSATNRTADGLFFPEEVLAWCARGKAHAASGPTREEIEDVLLDGGALLAPDPAILAVLRHLDSSPDSVRRSGVPDPGAVLQSWDTGECRPALETSRIEAVLRRGGCLRWRERDCHPELVALAGFFTRGPKLETLDGTLSARRVADWWNSRHTPHIDARRIAPVLSRGLHLNKLDHPVLVAWAWLRSNRKTASGPADPDPFARARRILAWWRELPLGRNHLVRWSGKPEAEAQLAGLLALLDPTRRSFHPARRTLRLDSRWSLLGTPLDAYVTCEFAIPDELWQASLGAVWRRSGWAFLRLGTRDAKPCTHEIHDA